MEPETSRAGWGSVGWLVADAAIAALFAGAAETLLLFLLSPERPLTLGDFAATLLALTPHIVAVFVLGGPALVVLGRLLSVARTTQRGISVRYVLRFALFDAVLLSFTAIFQWRRFESVVPEPGRTALALMTTALVLTTATLTVILLRDSWRPVTNLLPWLAATAVGLVVTLGIAAELRRVRVPAPEPISLPGFAPRAQTVILEIPGLSPRLFQRASESGEIPALAALQERGVAARIRPGVVDDSLALHASLITGQEASRHGVLRAVRYSPLGDRRSFAVLPNGLLLRPLVNTPLWRRIPVDFRVLRVVGLPGIVTALSGGPEGHPDDALSLALVGDPLSWPARGESRQVVSERLLSEGAPIVTGGEAVVCPPAAEAANRFFDPPASSLERYRESAALVTESLATDRCSLRVAAAVLRQGADFVHARLSGFPRVAERFAGFDPRAPARGVSEREIAAYGKVLRRYIRELDPDVGELVESGGAGVVVAVVSPHGVAPRQDFFRVLKEVVGMTEASGSFAGPQEGLLVLAGPGVATGGWERELEVDLVAVLPTLLAAAGLPVAEEMAPPARPLLDVGAVERLGIVTIPGYAVKRAMPR